MKFASVTNKFVGSPYCGQGFSKEEGFDCFSLVVNLLREGGVDIPEDVEFMGLTLKTYYELWEKEPNTAIDAMVGFLEKHAGRIKLGDIRVGDIMIVKDEDGVRFGGIYGGNDKIITSDLKKGVVGLPIRYYEIEDIFRGYNREK